MKRLNQIFVCGMIFLTTQLCTGCGQGPASTGADTGKPDPNGAPVPVGKQSSAGWDDQTQGATTSDKQQ